MRSTAIISPCGAYRYRLERVWNEASPPCVFVMLNPSTADADSDDPTIRKCSKFARWWGHGGLVVVNLFAFRATDPMLCKAQGRNAIGPANDDAIREAVEGASRVVAAWGPKAWARDRVAEVKLLLPSHTVCLKRANDGSPWHPLFVRDDAEPEPFFRGFSAPNPEPLEEPRP